MIHAELAQGRWLQISLAEQLGNVGSEYERALRWQTQGDERFQKAFDRFLELLDLTIADTRHSFHRRRELLRLRESACAELLNETENSGGLSRYFYYFGLLARRAV